MTPAPLGGVLLDASAISQHLRLLGKDPLSVRVRAFAHKDHPNKPQIGARKGIGIDLAKLARWQAEERNIYLVVNEGGDTAKSITSCIAFWVEWDDKPISWQLTAWQALGLPEPTFILSTGGRSLHCYWVLSEPIPPDQWAPIQSALLEHAGADSSVKDPSRVLRLAGTAYIGPDGLPQNHAAIVSAHGADYTVEDIASALAAATAAPEPEPQPAPRKGIVLDDGMPAGYHPHDMAEIRQALKCIPRRTSGSYEFHRNVLWGLVAAVEEVGGTVDDAIALMEEHSPSDAYGWDIAQVARSGNGSYRANTFWHHAKKHGHKRRDSAPITLPSQPATTDDPPFEKRPDTTARWGKVRLTINRRIDAFQHCIHALTQQERNSLRRMARVRHALLALELKTAIQPKEVGQMVLEQLDERTGNRFAPLTAADRAAMPIPTVLWEIPGCIPRGDLTIIGGRAKVGKTRLANALVRCLLRQEDFLGFGPPPAPRTVVLVTDDQGDGDTAEMLQQLQLWDHPSLIWSRRFRVTEANLDALLACISANPGAVVILDSLRSITRSTAFSENDPEMGGLIYDLKGAIVDAGGTLLLIHHCNKGNDSTGTEALSGHNAIAGAANSILTLHYMAKGARLQKDSPQRRMVREARSGPPADLVVAFEPSTGSFIRVGEYDAVVEAEQEAEKTATQSGGDLAKADADVKAALRFLHTVYQRGEDKAPGLLDVCKAIAAVPIEARRMADLIPDELTRYKRIGRNLGRYSDLVVQEKVPTTGGFFVSYALTDAGVEAVERAGIL